MSKESIFCVLWAPVVDCNGMLLTGNTVTCSLCRTSKLTVGAWSQVCIRLQLPPGVELPESFPRVLLAQSVISKQ